MKLLIESHRPQLYASLLVLLLILLNTGLNSSRIFERLDLMTYDLMYPFHAGEMSDEVVIVAVDNNSIEQLGRWPWSRREHARLVDRLTEMDAAAIGIDILFTEPQRDDPGADQAFAIALHQSNRVVLAAAPGIQQDGMITELLPLPELAINAAGIGHVDTELDKDGLCRRVFLYGGINDAHWPALALAMLQTAGKDPSLSLPSDFQENHPTDSNQSESWVRQKSMFIPFAARDQKPTIISWIDLVNGSVPGQLIRNKYILVGATATGLGDVLATPAAQDHERMPGVEVNAHILNALIQGKAIYSLTRTQHFLLSSALILISSVVILLLLPLRISLLSSAVMIGAALITTLTLLSFYQLWFSPVSTVITIAAIWPVWTMWQLNLNTSLRKKLLTQLQYQAQHHRATGMPNSGMLEDRLNQLTLKKAANQITGLMIIHFEWPGSASTTLGRPIGDLLLQSIGERLRSEVSENDFIAHLNGDDFAVLITQTNDKESIEDTAVALLKQLQQPIEVNGESLLLSPQIGVSVWSGDDNEDNQLLRNAYTAMFKSRIDDSEHLCIYSADIGQQLKIRSQLEQALIHALERDEFEIYYQPQILANSGQIIGTEALLRWNNPQLGSVSPEEFIPVAEHVGLIRPIGEWVMNNACKQLKAWQDEGLPPLRLAVNVSPLQFIDPDLGNAVKRIIQKTGIKPEDLELEITEGSLMWDMETAIKMMNQIKQQGIILAIDDFGTGYSSLSNLRHFPLDRLKIDKSFTQEIGTSSGSTEITLTILTIGKRLGMSVIAEGIETQEQATFLRNNGCDEFQGFMYSHPLPADKMTQLLRDGATIGINLKSAECESV
ncbi:EAL domain-containing protein [Amphritea japonica]|uniref:cyclic-guanylate-specific phosphodiesterase n=1 Tax=Amphritea japonica ATCC BAA-1530 TaxID=1278309 RepID=A0A7R6STW0_9GAMM|nr:EAL domain-containing protein [Amphritea japonica]BBB27062.1 signal transduction protein [Amphritea japonica ATCC BAA-1530]